MAIIDLHTHSTASDGTLSPTDLVHMAKDAKLSAIALTDHDTISGIPEALDAGARYGIKVIAGCELSVHLGDVKFHLLGLFLPASPGRLATELHELRQKRHDRNHVIVQKLRDMGIDIRYEEVTALAKGAVGRPHFAQVLVDKGVVHDVAEAFDIYLGARGRAYAPKDVLSADKAIELLAEENALSILAHPGLMRTDMDKIEALIVKLHEMGMDGIEAYYTEHTPTTTKAFLGIAKRLNMPVSGGSDFHGGVKPKIRLGTGTGRLRVPYSVLDELSRYHSRKFNHV
ncbi:PHP domain-containing protein [Desulfovibrio inopinatus]|uniref:PHP domain-containing protein n=1 Tax=Desulfovibrio inopinatus TaxID=102109 RepID=UPI0004066EAD|nr:PHP domain-containing protein [Desulfovibrio inopinatus]